MEDAHRQGTARAIGVDDFHPDRLVDLITHNEVVPAVNQIETHPYYQREADQDLMHERRVQIESWGPFAEGRNALFTHPVLSDIGAAHGKSVAQVDLRWLIQRDVVVIPSQCAATGWPRASTSSSSTSPTGRCLPSVNSTPGPVSSRPPRPAMTAQLGGHRLD